MPADNIIIRDELRELIPPLTASETAALQASILEEGIRDPLVLWGDVLIDGHNRYKIATRHNLPFKTVQRQFKDIYDAELWMIDNQYARRNLNDYQRGVLALKKQPILAAQAKERQEAAAIKGNKSRAEITPVPANLPGPAKETPTTPQPIEPTPVAPPTPKKQPVVKDRKAETRTKIADEAGVSPKTIHAITKIEEQAAPEIKKALNDGKMSINSGKEASKLPPEKQKLVVKKIEEGIAPSKAVTQVGREAKEEKREAVRQANREKVAAAPEPQKIEGVYNTIVIDPPWDWGDEGDGDQFGQARPDYATMSIDEIASLPVNSLADTNCHLYMWITNRSLPKGFALMEAFGFRYITCITWVKPHFGIGNYFRGQSEQILFGVKGSQPLLRKNAGTVFSAPRGPRGHSSKPEEFYPFVESCSPGPYLEMFARSQRNGWVSWGE